MSWENSVHRLSDSSCIVVFYENIDTNDSYWIQCIKTRSTENGCRNFQHSTHSSSIREKLENASNLSQSSRCFVEDNNGNDKDWNVGRQGHHPTNHLGPRWVRTTTVLHWLVAHEAEYQDQLTSYNTIGIRPSPKVSNEHQWKSFKWTSMKNHHSTMYDLSKHSWKLTLLHENSTHKMQIVTQW